MYHRVLPGAEMHGCPSHPGIVVSRETFAEHMAFVGEHLRPISVEELTRHLEDNAPFEDKSCLVTFDDGWRDNFEHAFPILRELHIPAVIFLPTDFVGGSLGFWQERLFTLLMNLFKALERAGGNGHLPDGTPCAAEIRKVLSADQANLRNRVFAFVSEMKQKSQKEREELIQALETGSTELSGRIPEAGERSFLSWEEIRAMRSQGISFGSHGKGHRILTSLTGEALREEVVAPGARIRDELGQAPTAFAYPNGNVNADVSEQVARAGYRAAFTTSPGYFSRQGDPLHIHRINIHESMGSPVPMFAGKLALLW